MTYIEAIVSAAFQYGLATGDKFNLVITDEEIELIFDDADGIQMTCMMDLLEFIQIFNVAWKKHIGWPIEDGWYSITRDILRYKFDGIELKSASGHTTIDFTDLEVDQRIL